MSIPKPSEESWRRPRSRGGLQINADGGEADLSDAVTGSMEGDNDQAGGKFTEEEMAIHRVHRQACAVR